MKKDVIKGQIMKKLEFDCKAKDDEARRSELNIPDFIIVAARFRYGMLTIFCTSGKHTTF